jgi:hypothetical protein
MARTNTTLSQNEIDALVKFCDEHNIVVEGSAGEQIGREIIHYIVNIWKEELTPHTLGVALDKLRDRLVFYEPKQKEYERVLTGLSAEEQQALKEWKSVRGLKNSFHNAVALVSWIKAHGFKVTQANLLLALQQNRVAPFLEWEPTPRERLKSEPVVEDDPGRRPGQFIEPSQPLWKQDRDRREREAAEKNQASKPQLSAEQQRWKQMAEEKLGSYRSHSQKEAYQGVQRRIVEHEPIPGSVRGRSTRLESL